MDRQFESGMKSQSSDVAAEVNSLPSQVQLRSSPAGKNLEEEVLKLGTEIFDESQGQGLSLFQKNYWSGKLMNWSMQYPEFKTQLFKFVNLLPSLGNSDIVVDRLRQYFLEADVKTPVGVKPALSLALGNPLTSSWVANFVSANIRTMATQFITGSNPQSAFKSLERLWADGSCFTVDILGESALSEEEALDYQRRYLALIEDLPGLTKNFEANPKIEKASFGEIPRVNVSVKLSSLYSQIDPLAFEQCKDILSDRLRPLLRAAKAKGVFVNIDMEQNELRELFFAVAQKVFCEPEFSDYPNLGIVVQAYLKSAEVDIDKLLDWARGRKAPMSVRLVKGAYWDSELAWAKARGWPVPVFLKKPESDASFELCAKKLIDAYPVIRPCFGSHNIRSLSFAAAYAESLGLDRSVIEVQMLYGMAEPFKVAVKKLGFRLREYAPVGEILPGMAYLVRRLLENTSNEGFLKTRFVDNKSMNELLKNPKILLESLKTQTVELSANERNDTMSGASTTKFSNEPLKDFSIEQNRKEAERAISTVRATLPLKCEVVIGGRILEGLKRQKIHNPSELEEIVSDSALATEAEAEMAINAAVQGMKSWGQVPVGRRAEVLRKAAAIMRDRKAELSAVMTLEVGKNFREADADVCEAIDFCEYYANEMERLSKPLNTISTSGESNHYHYTPRGPTLVIAPWNFPLAILCGMTVAPLVCGDTVVMKPAETSAGIAFKLYEILREAGVPAEAVHLLPGPGSQVGAYLVKHPEVHVINFTGSRSVGLWILENASVLAKGQRHIKRCIVELGGKNAIIVDEDADLDAAVAGILHSAFGFQGQKCSALSRLLVHQNCYDKLRDRLIASIKNFSIGKAEDVNARVGPVIDAESQGRLLEVIQRNKSQIVAQVEVPESLRAKGHYVPPTLFESQDPLSELGQVEFFGPLLTLFKIKDFDEGVKIFNNSDYALTGGIFSRNPRNLERARLELDCGNLYVNRAITGAFVFKHPFGGFKLSGAGGKAGGPDYLLNFLEPRTTSEKVG